jgi:predicted nucleic acid-binding protein
MYAAGREHPFKRRAAVFLENVADGSIEVVLDSEVFQEMLHRYRALGRWAEGQNRVRHGPDRFSRAARHNV